ncbi:hypothetical protein NPIL_326001 [Nephila pilipes]|uniref:OCEL domain-containing protein n=1 Tax=Nephila pilipes TaxID=299642 RepID=A0A8X6TY87_NEPPI|nr:hypothetical protein NPIL_302431 [Nephila pilipes]GFT59155.1 hypothetical protein NPIL_326001 [Nephila pilipes]
MKNTNQDTSMKSGLMYLKMNSNKISPLNEVIGMHSLKRSDTVPLHKRFSNKQHKLKDFYSGLPIKSRLKMKDSLINPSIHPSIEGIKKRGIIKVSIPIEYSNGVFKVPSILKTSKSIHRAKNVDQVSEVKPLSVFSSKRKNVDSNFTVKSANPNLKIIKANLVFKKSGLVYLKLNSHKLSPLEELDAFSQKNSAPYLLHNNYHNVGCNHPLPSLSKSLPIYKNGEITLLETSENSSIMEFPMEWDNLEWGIDDHYQDVTDYKKCYSKITSKEQRNIYYANYTVELQEYRDLHSQIINIKKLFENLQLHLSSCQRGTNEYKEIHSMLDEKYKAYQKDHNYIYTRLRSNHLHIKLSYIKKLIKEFDKM